MFTTGVIHDTGETYKLEKNVNSSLLILRAI